MSPKRVLLASGGYDHTLRFWDAQSATCIRHAQHNEGQINSLAATTDKELVAVAGYAHIRLYETHSTKATHDFAFDNLGRNVTGVGFQEDARWLYSSSEEGAVRIFDLRTNASATPTKYCKQSAPINCIVLHPNQTTLFYGDQDGIVHCWDVRSDHVVQYLPERDSSIQSVDMDPEGVYLACVTSRGSCQLWSLTGHDPTVPRILATAKSIWPVHSRYALSCRFSPDSTLLATTASNGIASVWRTADCSLQAQLNHESPYWVWDTAFTADSQYIFTASSDAILRLWNIDDASVRKEYHGHQKAVVAIVFKDDIC